MDTVDNPDHRRRIELAFVAMNCGDLLPLLDAAIGTVIGGVYKIDSLLATGGQFIVWSGTEIRVGRRVVIKQARFDYRYPVRYGIAEAVRLRNAVYCERDVLWSDRSGTLPQPFGLIVGDSIVPSAISPVLAHNEVFVAEEYVRGSTISELTLRRWPSYSPVEREKAAARISNDFVGFWQGLHASGWHYGDLSADNLLVEESGRLRVVDAGSAVQAANPVTLTGYTPAYTTPGIYAAVAAGNPVEGSLASVLPQLGKVLHFALTRREPLNGQFPDLSEPRLDEYSTRSRRALELMLELDRSPARLPEVLAEIKLWGAFHQA